MQSNSHTTHTSNRIQCIFISWLLFYLILECVSLIMESISILYFNWLPFGRNNLRDASYKLLGWMIVQWYLHSLYFDGNCLNFFIFIWYLVRRDINKKSLNKFSYQIKADLAFQYISCLSKILIRQKITMHRNSFDYHRFIR